MSETAIERYTFYIHTTNGSYYKWSGMSAHKAKQMYLNTERHTPENVHKYGWCEDSLAEY